ncbi:MAG: SIMPL domain-containing protein [Candidatus Micrarchaeota archaeon]
MVQQAENSTLLVLGVVLIVLITAGLTYYISKAGNGVIPLQNQSNTTGEPPTITVRGEATKTLPPDLLTIGLSVETVGSNTSDSQAKNAVEIAKLKSALLAAGVKESDIETSSYYTYPEYNESCYTDCYYPYYGYSEKAVPEGGIAYEASASRCIGAEGEAIEGPDGVTYRCGAMSDSDSEVAIALAEPADMDIAPSPPYPYPCERNCNITGYKTSHVLIVKTEKINDGGKITDAALGSSAYAKIDYIYFGIKEETRVRVESELQASAAAAAKTKADNIAKGLGAKLGKIVSINPDYYYPYYPVYAYDASSSYESKPPTEFFPTDTTMSSSMTVVYELVQ